MRERTHRDAVTRRQALGFLGAAGVASFIVLGRGGRAWAATCTVTPAETEGPYWVDELLNRSVITVDPSDGSVKPGVPLRLNINVYRADDGCAPASGVQVDVWHCDAGCLYSDETANNTVGKKFLRGYQVTDDTGAVQFTTIYPGWYSSRTIHIHFRVRTFNGSTTTYNFASQLFFDDTTSNQVLGQSPYNTRGARDTTNATDTIYTSATLLTLTTDGSGGYVGTFDVALNGLPATSGGGSGSCTDMTSCRAAVTAALPGPDAAADRKSRAVALRLARLNGTVGRAIDRAVASSGAKRSRSYRKARKALEKLLAKATAADANGTLGVSLAPLEQAVNALLGFLPSV